MASEFDVIVVGGGAAGMFSAGTAAASRGRVLLLERNRALGRKLRITGKGRCNLTNDCTAAEVLENVPTGGRFLYSCVTAFPPQRTKAFFEDLGVPLKTERGRRVFPVSDRAGDVVQALARWLETQGVTVEQGRVRRLLLRQGQVAGVQTDTARYYAPGVILATGGLSYPATGSTGDGYALARQAGHSVTELSGSLVPLQVEGGCGALKGLTLRNTGLTLWGGGKKPLYQDFGELTFLEDSLSGPTVLSASAHLSGPGPYRVELDLKPALSQEALDARLLRDFAQKRNQSAWEGLRGLLPGAMTGEILNRAGIPWEEKVHDLTRPQRRDILQQMKHLCFSITGKRPVAEAIVTHGGVALKEVDPRTMASKRCPGLYFAGEILDLDAYTGGFNLQIAWSTGYAAGSSCGNSGAGVL